MIDRYACLPRSITRRKFGALIGSAVGAGYMAKKAMAAGGTPFTIAMVPDPQYLATGASTCGGQTAYNALIQWAVTNRNLSVNGTPLNVKGFLQVGDCCDTASSTVYNSQQSVSVAAYALAEAANPKMFVVRCLGNHDYMTPGSGMDRSTVSYMWRTDKSGPWSPANLASIYSGGMDLGNGDVAYYGGHYTDPVLPDSSINNYMRLLIQGRKILVIALEFYPQSAVLNWARGIHDTYPDHECWVTTHGYATRFGARFLRTDGYGPGTYTLGAAPASNSASEMWGGSDASWNGLTTWPNLSLVTCGHDIDGYTQGWVWQRLQDTSTSAKKQTVHQVFCNCQGMGSTGDLQNFCGGSSTTPDGATDAMHLMLLRIWPATAKLEAFLVSTNNGKWIGAQGVINQTSPVQLFNVPFGAPLTPSGLFPLPSAV